MAKLMLVSALQLLGCSGMDITPQAKPSTAVIFELEAPKGMDITPQANPSTEIILELEALKGTTFGPTRHKSVFEGAGFAFGELPVLAHFSSVSSPDLAKNGLEILGVIALVNHADAVDFLRIVRGQPVQAEPRGLSDEYGRQRRSLTTSIR